MIIIKVIIIIIIISIIIIMIIIIIIIIYLIVFKVFSYSLLSISFLRRYFPRSFCKEMEFGYPFMSSQFVHRPCSMAMLQGVPPGIFVIINVLPTVIPLKKHILYYKVSDYGLISMQRLIKKHILIGFCDNMFTFYLNYLVCQEKHFLFTLFAVICSPPFFEISDNFVCLL